MLVVPSDPLQASPRGVAEDSVRNAFARVLMREPDEVALKVYSDLIGSGELDAGGLILVLLDSEEFGARAQMRPAVSRHLASMLTDAQVVDAGRKEEVARALEHGVNLAEVIERDGAAGSPVSRAAVVRSAFGEVLGREPEPAALDAYVDALKGGLAPMELVGVLLASEEFSHGVERRRFVAERLVREAFRGMTDRAPAAPDLDRYVSALVCGEADFGAVITELAATDLPAGDQVPAELGLLMEQLIVRNLNARGAALAPPVERRVDPLTITGARELLHTLAMVSEPART